MQLHGIEAHLNPATLDVLGQLTVRRKQRELRALLRVLIEGFDDPALHLVLAVVDLPEIQHLALHDPAISAALGFNDIPVAMLLAVLEAPIASQIHDADVL